MFDLIMFDLQWNKRHAAHLNEMLKSASGKDANELAKRVETIVWQGNRRDRLQGVDRRGAALTPVKPRKGKYANATGPPLAPFGASSRVISGFYVRVSRKFGLFGGFSMRAGIKAAKGYIFQYHAAGRGRWGRVPRRDVLGMSPATHTQIKAAFRDFKAGILSRKGR